VVGLIITVILSRIGLFITAEMVKKQDWVWWYFTVIFVVTLPMLVFVRDDIIISDSYVAKPGQDYDIAKNAANQTYLVTLLHPSYTLLPST
jgi:uncharacterized membrane protein